MDNVEVSLQYSRSTSSSIKGCNIHGADANATNSSPPAQTYGESVSAQGSVREWICETVMRLFQPMQFIFLVFSYIVFRVIVLETCFTIILFL